VIGVDKIPSTPEAAEESLVADVTSSDAVSRLAAAIRERHGGIDVLLNVVGASGRRHGDGPVHECSDEGWDWVMDVNLRSVFLMCRAFVPVMQRSGGGSIINLGSALGLIGHELFATHAYAAAKGAVIAMSRAMAVRYAGDRIRVNVIAPGLIRTPMSARAQENEAILGQLSQLAPLTGDFGLPEDVAEAAVYLASDESRFVTGVVLPVDGGWTAT